jgi:flagellar hook-associated protein 3 FlgL
MIARVTNQTMMHSAQRNLQAGAARLAELQDKAASQKAINRPSDDPTATGAAMQVRGQQAAASQYSRNMDNGNTWLTTIDSALGSSTKILRKIQDLVIQGSNDVLTPGAKEAIAAEIEGLGKDLLSQANTTVMGRSVFAGNSDAPAAFDNATPPNFTGTAGSAVERRIGSNQTVRVDADGAAAFGTGATSVFKLIDDIASDLRLGVNPSAHLAAIGSRFDAVVTQQSDIGARQAQLLRAQEVNMTEQGLLEAQRSGIEDADLSQTVLDLQLQQTNYQVALAVTAKVLPMTLMDFLR